MELPIYIQVLVIESVIQMCCILYVYITYAFDTYIPRFNKKTLICIEKYLNSNFVEYNDAGRGSCLCPCPLGNIMILIRYKKKQSSPEGQVGRHTDPSFQLMLRWSSQMNSKPVGSARGAEEFAASL